MSIVLAICFFVVIDGSKADESPDDDMSIEETIEAQEIDPDFDLDQATEGDEEELCAIVDEEIMIHMPSVELGASYFNMVLGLYDNSEDTGGNIYFSLNELNELLEPTTPCALMDENLNIEVNCIDVNGLTYTLTLERYINPLDGEWFYWKVANIGLVEEPLDSSENDYGLDTATYNRPNLTPYRPYGWSSKVVVSTRKGSTTNSSSIDDSDSLYVDWAVINNGSSSIYRSFYTRLYVDGRLKKTWRTKSLGKNRYTYVKDYYIGRLSQGRHSIKIKTDATGTVGESNGRDNEYTKIITVGSSNSNYKKRMVPYLSCGWFWCEYRFSCKYSSNTRYRLCN